MEGVVAVVCAAFAFGMGIGAYFYARLRGNVRKMLHKKKSILEGMSKAAFIRQGKEMPISCWMALVAFAILAGAACFQMQECQLDILANIRVLAGVYLFLVAAVIDMQLKKIPNGLILSGLILAIVLTMLEWSFYRETFMMLLLSSIGGMLFFFLLFFVLSVALKQGIGMGDVKLVTMSGALVGLADTFYALVYGMLLCMLAAIFMLLFQKKSWKDSIPFGPFFYMGYCIAVIVMTF